jgi:hypothetical protein
MLIDPVFGFVTRQVFQQLDFEQGLKTSFKFVKRWHIEIIIEGRQEFSKLGDFASIM